jgi:uncharacterized protein
MPRWSEYKTMARERGALALELFAVESTPKAEPEAIKAVLPEHLAYQGQLEAAGSLVLAEPLSDDTGELMESAGLIIYRADSLDAAHALADADPMHLKGARTYRLRRWLVNEGNLNFQLRLSKHAVEFS